MIAPDATCSHDKSHTGSVVAYERGDLDLRVAALRRAERPVADGAGAVSEVSSVRVQDEPDSTDDVERLERPDKPGARDRVAEHPWAYRDQCHQDGDHRESEESPYCLPL